MKMIISCRTLCLIFKHLSIEENGANGANGVLQISSNKEGLTFLYMNIESEALICCSTIHLKQYETSSCQLQIDADTLKIIEKLIMSFYNDSLEFVNIGASSGVIYLIRHDPYTIGDVHYTLYIYFQEDDVVQNYPELGNIIATVESKKLLQALDICEVCTIEMNNEDIIMKSYFDDGSLAIIVKIKLHNAYSTQSAIKLDYDTIKYFKNYLRNCHTYVDILVDNDKPPLMIRDRINNTQFYSFF